MSSSNVGNAQTYEAGDQRVPPDSQKAENQATPYEEGKENSHKDNDSSESPHILSRAIGPRPIDMILTSYRG